MYVITTTFTFILVFTINKPLMIISTSSAKLNDNKSKDLQSGATISPDNGTNNLDSNIELNGRTTEKYRDCTDILINKTRQHNVLMEYNYYEGYYLYPSTLKESFDFIYRPRLWGTSRISAIQNDSIYRWEVIDCDSSVCLMSASPDWQDWFIWSIPGKSGRPAPYSPQLRETDSTNVKNDEKFKFIVQCSRDCDDHMDSGFGDCEIVNKCTAKKENTTAGYKLYAGWDSLSPETFLREESEQDYDNDWFSWKIHLVD